MDNDENPYLYCQNIRDFLGGLIGLRVIDITQQDREEFEVEESGSYVMLMFEDGSYLKFPIGDEGFHHNLDDPRVEGEVQVEDRPTNKDEDEDEDNN